MWLFSIRKNTLKKLIIFVWFWNWSHLICVRARLVLHEFNFWELDEIFMHVSADELFANLWSCWYYQLGKCACVRLLTQWSVEWPFNRKIGSIFFIQSDLRWVAVYKRTLAITLYTQRRKVKQHHSQATNIIVVIMKTVGVWRELPSVFLIACHFYINA